MPKNYRVGIEISLQTTPRRAGWFVVAEHDDLPGAFTRVIDLIRALDSGGGIDAKPWRPVHDLVQVPPSGRDIVMRRDRQTIAIEVRTSTGHEVIRIEAEGLRGPWR